MRRYGKWAGNEAGTPEDDRDCVVEVWRPNVWRSLQCGRRRGKGEGTLRGLLCWQHAKQQAAGQRLFVPRDEEEV